MSDELKLAPIVNDWLHARQGAAPQTYENLALFHPGNFGMVDNSKKYKNKLKVAVLPESPEYDRRAYMYIFDNHAKFDHIFTCDKELLNLDPEKFHYLPITDCWISGREKAQVEKNPKIRKTKNISAIFSDKQFLSGHRIRQLIYQKYQNTPEVDFYGTITGKRLKHKCEALLQYRFSLAVENCIKDFYFTEKVLDCLMCKTIPLYWGATEFIEKHFNPQGFLTFRTLEDLPAALSKCNTKYYNSKRKAVNENFEIMKDFVLQRPNLVSELNSLIQN